MDHGGEAGVRFVGAHRDALELLEFTEEVLDQMTPFVHLCINRQRPGAARVLRDDDFGPARIEISDDGVAVKGFVGDQRVKAHPCDERRDAHGVEPMAGQEFKADEIAECIGQRQNLGGHAAFGAANDLALSPPFAPWPCRWTLTIVASTMAYSMSGSSETASNIRLKTSALTQCRNRLNTVFQGPNSAGRSRQGLPVRAIYKTASRNS